MLKISLIAILTFAALQTNSFASIIESIEENINSEKIEEQNGKLSHSTKDLLKKIYQRKLQENKPKKQQKITIERFNHESIESDYETAKGDQGIDITVKKPGKKLTRKLNLYQDAFFEVKNQKYESAIVKFDKILVNYPNDRIALSGVASSYHKLGEFEIANDYYVKALNLYQNDQKLINNFLTLLAEEAPDESLAELLKLDKVTKKNAVLKAQIANLYVYKKNYEEALNYIQYAILIDKNNLSYHFNKAVILNKIGLKNEAKMILNKIIASNNYSEFGISLEKIKRQLK